MNTVLHLSLAASILLGVTTACPAAAIPVVAHEMKLLRSTGRVWKHSDGWLARMVTHSFTAEFYAEMLRRAGRAIRAADPEARIVGLGGSCRCAWCLDVIERLGGRPRETMD